MAFFIRHFHSKIGNKCTLDCCLNRLFRIDQAQRRYAHTFEELKDYDWIIKETFEDGYAEFYLRDCWNGSKLINEANVEVYKRLVDIDTNLGTGLSLQLWRSLRWTTRWDIIKVCDFYFY